MMEGLSVAARWIAGGGFALMLLIVLRRPLGRLWRLAVRCAVGLAALGALGKVGALAGVALGVNWVNALVLGALGLPGFGLLLMLNWVLR